MPALVRALESPTGGVVDTPLVEATFSAEELPGGRRPSTTSSPSRLAPACPTLAAFMWLSHRNDHRGRRGRGRPGRRLHPSSRGAAAGAARRVTRGSGGGSRPGGGHSCCGRCRDLPGLRGPRRHRNAGDEPVTRRRRHHRHGRIGVPLPRLPTGVRATLLTYTTVSPDWEMFPPGPAPREPCAR